MELAEPTSAGESYLGLKTAMERLRAALQTVKDAPVEMEQILRRIEQLIFDLEFVPLGEDENFVACCERRGRVWFCRRHRSMPQDPRRPALQQDRHGGDTLGNT
jgi:hypothetical protein